MVTLAACIFVFIPPTLVLPPVSAIRSISSVISSTTGMNSAFALRLGLYVNKPSMSESKISKSAPRLLATNADNVSLSPNFSSSTATVSFSLIIGITPDLSNVINVFLMLRYRCLLTKSPYVNKTWAMICPNRAKERS